MFSLKHLALGVVVAIGVMLVVAFIVSLYGLIDCSLGNVIEVSLDGGIATAGVRLDYDYAPARIWPWEFEITMKETPNLWRRGCWGFDRVNGQTVIEFPLWLLAVIDSLALLILGPRYKTFHPGRCAACGYDLFGLNSTKCPECGHSGPTVPQRRYRSFLGWASVVAILWSTGIIAVLIVNYQDR